MGPHSEVEQVVAVKSEEQAEVKVELAEAGTPELEFWMCPVCCALLQQKAAVGLVKVVT